MANQTNIWGYWERISLLNGDRVRRSALWVGLSKMFRVTPVTYGVHTHLSGQEVVRVVGTPVRINDWLPPNSG